MEKHHVPYRRVNGVGDGDGDGDEGGWIKKDFIIAAQISSGTVVKGQTLLGSTKSAI